MGFEIRDACADDHVRLHAIHHRATMSSYGRELAWLDAILADPATPLEAVEWTIVAADGEGVLGYAAVTANHLENLYVDPAAQGRGVGRALLAGVEARLGDRFATATLRCLHANPEARRLYERQGYRIRADQTVVLHGRPLAAWLMEKPLRGA
ncbi:MAG TPA: GNAT family N-acetyltransferase [Kofleriaceae bacterium]|jgi:ribosomal protein S18 acetylase RimI-like enzyme|nr:GNAT family N-acetyltransferase [Kofleriaceae bacterium]